MGLQESDHGHPAARSIEAKVPAQAPLNSYHPAQGAQGRLPKRGGSTFKKKDTGVAKGKEN